MVSPEFRYFHSDILRVFWPIAILFMMTAGFFIAN